MNEKAYNMYLKMIKLGLLNVKSEITRLNMFNEGELQVKIRGKDTLIKYVEAIVKDPKNAVANYKDKVDRLIVTRSNKPQIRTTSASTIFIESVIKSREARVAQKHLIDYSLAERYLQEAWEFDSKNPGLRRGETAIDKAKEVIAKTYSLNFLSNLVTNAGNPHLDETVKENLIKKAFDRKYSFATQETTQHVIRKRYQAEFVPRLSLFTLKNEARENALKIDAIRSSSKTPAAKRSPFHSVKETAVTSETLMLTELYKGTFAALPFTNKRRKFVNLKLRSNDILVCPIRNLAIKKQYSDIESMTKHTYIYDFYRDQMPSNLDETDAAQYYFRQENHMYQYMWGTKNSVHYQSGRLYFPDSTNVIVPPEYKPYEFFHKVNATYAALFGFGPQDVRGGKFWLYDTVRKAYTDEGTADYRLAMIEARLSGRIK